MQGEMRNLGLREGKLVTQDHAADWCRRSCVFCSLDQFSSVSLRLLPQAWGSVLAQCWGVSRLSGERSGMSTGWRVQRCELHTQLMGCGIRKEIHLCCWDRPEDSAFLFAEWNKKLGDICVQRPNVVQSLDEIFILNFQHLC